MKKEAIIINFNGKPIIVSEIKNFNDLQSFLEFQKECEDNLNELKLEIQEKDNYIKGLEKRIQLIELELKFNRGEITEEEYDGMVTNC